MALADRNIVLLPVPGGTFNHFAKTVDVVDLDAAAAAAERGDVIDVPVADLNGEAFLNTASLGWYPAMVRTRERLRRRFPRPVAAAVAFARHLPGLHRFDVDLEGRTYEVWLLWVGNGRFGLRADDATVRDDIAEGVLDLRLALAHQRFARSRLMWDVVRGRLQESERFERVVTDRPVEIRLHTRTADAALDAEVMTMTSPLTVTPCARTLRVLIPPSEVR
ncbi:hypothetical protein BH24ACT5_BH24ACT5_15250 [soil metagenome]